MSAFTSTHGEPLTCEPTVDQQADLRGMLEQQRAFRIEQLIQLHGPGAQGKLHRPLDDVDQEIVASLAEGARAALRDVQNALWRMDEGRYGRCTCCHDPIGLERLEILPQVALCMPCQRASARSG